MAEVVALMAGIGSILKVIGSATTVIKGIAQAPQEAAQIATQLEATSAILTSMKHSFAVVCRSQEFLDIWSGSTHLVLRNIQATTEQLNTKLGSDRNRTSRLNLGFWRKITWPLGREETLMLQLQLQGYMQMSSMIQNAFLQSVRLSLPYG